jgi:hypothetical protein
MSQYIFDWAIASTFGSSSGRAGTYQPQLYLAPQSTMVAGLEYLIFPCWLPVASMALTISIDFLPTTSPNTTCLPFSQEVTAVVMKNWEPFLDTSQTGDGISEFAEHDIGTDVYI